MCPMLQISFDLIGFFCFWFQLNTVEVDDIRDHIYPTDCDRALLHPPGKHLEGLNVSKVNGKSHF